MSRYIDLRLSEEVQVLDLGGYYKYKVARCAHIINIMKTYHSLFCMDTANAPTKQHTVLAIAMAMATAMEPCRSSRFSADVPSGAVPAPGISAGGEHLSKHPRISHGASMFRSGRVHELIPIKWMTSVFDYVPPYI